jgi:hypothetical protein
MARKYKLGQSRFLPNPFIYRAAKSRALYEYPHRILYYYNNILLHYVITIITFNNNNNLIKTYVGAQILGQPVQYSLIIQSSQGIYSKLLATSLNKWNLLEPEYHSCALLCNFSLKQLTVICRNFNLWLRIIRELHGNYTLSGTQTLPVNINISGDITQIPPISVPCPRAIRTELLHGTLIGQALGGYVSQRIHLISSCLILLAVTWTMLSIYTTLDRLHHTKLILIRKKNNDLFIASSFP